MSLPGGARFEVLGRAVVRGPSGTDVAIARPQVAAVLALLWDEDRPVRREEVAELLWGEWDLPDHWQGAVRGVVAKARRALEAAGFPDDTLTSDHGLIRLRLPEGAHTDLAEAERLVGRAGDALAAGDHSQAEAVAARAVALLAHPLVIVAEGDWPRRLHLRAETFDRQARRLVVRARLAAGRTTEAIAAASELVARDRLDEVAHELLIEANLAAGRRGAAQEAYERLIEVLERELGAEPAPHLAELITNAPEPSAGAPEPLDVGQPFLGRCDELAALAAAAAETAATGKPSLMIVQGPTGIGKSRLTEEFVARGPVGPRRGLALWGRCHAEDGAPFEPFVDALAGLVTDGHLAGDARDAVELTLDSLVRDGHSLYAHGTRDRRARTVQSVVDTFERLAAQRPLVLVVDDLQWASGDSIALLQRLLEHPRLPLFVVATARSGLREPGPATELLRAAPTQVIDLAALAVDDLEPLADQLVGIAGRPIEPASLSRLLWERTGGLPYYLCEVARDARRRRSLEIDAIPEHVRAWVHNRVAALPGDQGSLVEVAAVIGEQPSVALVEATWLGPSSAVLVGLEQLVRAGFLAETDDPDVLEFPHQITRDVIADGIGAARRARLHATVAAALARVGGEDLPHARIAFHLAHAGPDHEPEAARHGYLAGVASLSRGAWAQADSQFADARVRAGPVPTHLTAAILVAWGWTRHALGDATEATRLLDEATEVADRLRLPHEAARAALFLTGRAGRGAAHGMSDSDRIRRLERALEAVCSWDAADVDHDTALFPMGRNALAALRTGVEVELAWAMLFTGSLDQRAELLAGTLERARADRAEPARLARALLAQRNVATGPGQVTRRIAISDEVLALPREALPVDTVVSAWLCRHEDLLSVGDRAGARAALDAASHTVHLHAHPYWHWATATWESLWKLVNGDPDAAEVALGAASGLQPAGSTEAAACAAVQLVAIRLAQRRAGEVVDLLASSARARPEVPAYRAVLALAASLAGDTATAAEAYGHFAADGFASVPVDSNRLLTLAVLGDVAADLGDARAAAILDERLAPDDGTMVVLNGFGGGGSWWGPVARVRSRLADVLGRPREADAARKRARAAIAELGAATLGQPGL